MSKELVVDYFDRHTNDECFITSDGRVFHTKGTADGHANTLKDNNVESHKRNIPAVDSDGSDDSDTLKIEAVEALKTFDTSTATYPEIKALANTLGLESASQKKDDLVAALEVQKAIINTEIQD